VVWKLAEAKNRLSELVTRAFKEGPQIIRRHDASVVVVSEDTYLALTGERPSLKSMLLEGPSLEGVLPTRDRTAIRSVKL